MDRIRKVAVVPIELEGELYNKSHKKVRETESLKEVNEKEVRVIKVKPKKWKLIK